MASKKDTSLDFMGRLSANVLYYDPKTPRSPDHPSLILLCSWMGARNAHIAKYTAQYQQLFPSSPILLVTFSPKNFTYFWPQQLKPAAEIIRADLATAIQEGKEKEVRMLVHVFSNGGAGSMRYLLDAIGKSNNGGLALPRHVLIWDSAPGTLDWMYCYRSMAASSPTVARPFLHLWLAIGWLLYTLPGRPSWFEKNITVCRDPSFLALQTRRLYFYGTADKMVRYNDIEDDAAEVRKMVEEGKVDGPVVTTEKFEKSGHVSHARVDFERYWGAVEEAWKRREIVSSRR